MCVDDKRVDLYGIRIDAGYIAQSIQKYERIPEISGSDLVYILYFDNPPQVKSHNQFVHGKISMTQNKLTLDSHTFEINKIPSPS